MTDLNLDIFESDEQRAAAASVLPQFIDSPGWKLVTKVLALNIEYFANELKDRHDFTSLEEVYRLQDRLGDLSQLSDLPAILLAEATATSPDEDTDDPFEQGSDESEQLTPPT